MPRVHTLWDANFWPRICVAWLKFAQRRDFQLEEAQNLRRSAKLRWSNLQNGANFVS